jgi:uncharacterized membrane protein
MNALRREPRQWLLLVFAIVGAGVAIYLTTVHYEHVPLLCSAQGVVNCERVTSSSYSVVPGTTLPITIPGLAWFAVSATLALVGIRSGHRWLRRAELGWTLLGTVTALYLVYVEIVVLHTICLWCSVVHVLLFGSLLVAMIDYALSGREQGQEAEEESVVATPPQG